MIPFNKPLITGDEIKYIQRVLKDKKLSGDGLFSWKCQQYLEGKMNCQKVLLVPSGTHALEMAAILANIEKGDEVIMPSYTFTSTANAFVLRGAKIVFVDIRPETMNINEDLIERAITKKTKAIVPVHYAGVSCKMDKILTIARKYNLLVIEDAAHAVLASYKGKYLGTIGDFGCLSFHETKNLTCGEGGAILINNKKFSGRAEIVREKGTNRLAFLKGEVDKYTWVDSGASYLVSELNASLVRAQLESAHKTIDNRLKSWKLYFDLLGPLAKQGFINLPFIPEGCRHNGHIFYLKVKNSNERAKLKDYLKRKGIVSVFHYISLHSSRAGKKYGRFSGKDLWTTKESERILRLPMYYGLKEKDIKKITQTIERFYQK